jgi:hypothetical protein
MHRVTYFHHLTVEGVPDGQTLLYVVRLSYLAPDIVRVLLERRQPIELTPTRLLRGSKDLPHDWSEQRLFLCFADGRPVRRVLPP